MTQPEYAFLQNLPPLALLFIMIIWYGHPRDNVITNMMSCILASEVNV